MRDFYTVVKIICPCANTLFLHRPCENRGRRNFYGFLDFYTVVFFRIENVNFLHHCQRCILLTGDGVENDSLNVGHIVIFMIGRCIEFEKY